MNGRHQSGRLADFTGTCPRCDNPITRNVSRVVLRHGDWIHVECAPGGDDE